MKITSSSEKPYLQLSNLKAALLALIFICPFVGFGAELALFGNDNDGKEPKKESPKTTLSMNVKKKRTLVVNKKFPLIHVEKKYVFATQDFSEETLALRARKM